ncbi:MAG: phosphoribosylformylglycinamidine synthase [Rickettsiales bacterium]|nr:phosphoribosylformylglycinamidine synthase [Rickettsiales bacterium]OUV83100.1 MAG: hypothetical protein CBC91_01095 [Rickettsiales bacterium TMED131]|tara:strand:+ start:110 stop:364 length:255 start_codon:yes stop_codon:yes gene_type:complete
MYKVEIYVSLKKDVLDPQGKAISEAAKTINIKNILDIKQGKYFEVIIDKVKSIKDAKNIGEILSNKLLYNEVIENYEIIKITKL